MTFREKAELENKVIIKDFRFVLCPFDLHYEKERPDTCPGMLCSTCWDREIPETPKPIVNTVTDKEMKDNVYEALALTHMRENMEENMEEKGNLNVTARTIKDSGSRREFETGAVRDIQEGKGRCDLMPLDVIGLLFRYNCNDAPYDVDDIAYVFHCIHEFQEDGHERHLNDCLACFGAFENRWTTTFLEVSKHFEEGAKKYGENNWQRGIPTHCYIDSAVRHYLKFLRGDQDEPHDRAFVWNIMCCIWTCIHKPELNEYRKKGDKDGEN